MQHTTAGLGFKPEYFDEAMSSPAGGLWFEIHAENYMIAGGPRLAMLDTLRGEHPISVHGVGLSLAADTEPDLHHLRRLKDVVERSAAFVVSEHLAWSSWNGHYYPDLLPFPRTRAALLRVARNVAITQEVLGRQLLIENPSLYMPLDGHELSETDFLSELVARSGCGLLLDVNNVYVSAHNLGEDARAYIDAVPADAIGEIHLAGHSADARSSTQLLIDTHGAPICAEVWALYTRLIERIGARPTLIERDDNLPAFGELLAERKHAHDILQRSTHTASVQSHAHAV